MPPTIMVSMVTFSVYGLLWHLSADLVLPRPRGGVPGSRQEQWTDLPDTTLFATIQDTSRQTAMCQVQQLQNQ